jgi:hypothetical protein
MANQIVVSAGAKVRNLDGVLTGTSGVVNSLPINASNGIPQLDVNGKILVSQLPNSVMEYKGTWNVSTNTPTLVNGVGNQGDVYLVEGAAVGGTAFNFGAGPITFFNGDQVIYSGSIWQRASGATGSVTSVAITESGDSLNITGSPITTSGTINIGFNGTNLQYVNGAGNLTTFPDLSVYVTLAGTQTITGAKTFGIAKFDGGIYLKDSAITSIISGYTAIGSVTGGIYISLNGSIYQSTLAFNSAADFTYQFPSASGTIALTSDIPILTGYVPYTGATANVDLGTFNLTADVITGATGSFASSGGSDTFAINHSSGSGIALNITKGGNGEGLYINKTSGSGNAATIIGTLNATTLVKSGGTSSQFLKADGTVDSSTYLTTSAAASTYLPLAGGTLTGNLGFAQPVGLLYANGQYIKDNGSGGLFIHSAAAINITSTSLTNNSNTILDSSNYNSYALPLTGGTLTGALNINLSSGTAMNVAGNAIFRGDTGVGTPRQLIITSGGSTPVYLEAKGYGANYQTDFGIRTYNNVGTAFEVFYANANGNVGINQTSPAHLLDVNGTFRAVGDAVLGGGSTIFGTTGSKFYIYPAFSAGVNLLQNYSGSAYTTEEHRASDYVYKIGTTAALTIASTGAATFSSSVTATQGKFSGSRPQGIFTENGTSGLYLRDATGTGYKSWSIGTNDIVVGFAITPSTAVGGTTFTTPSFVINESGNVGIGISSPSVPLEVYSTTADATNNPGNSQIRASASSTKWLSIGYDPTINAGYLQGAENAVSWRPIILNLNGTTTSPVLIGQSTSDGVNKLQVNGGIYASSSIAAVVASNIDMFVFSNTGATYTKAAMVASIAATGGTGSYFFYGQQSTSTVALKIFSNGNIQNTNNSYGAISDARLKENIIDATPKLDDLMKVKVRNYNLKGESNKQLGVISQELEAIFPNMIEESTNIGSDVKIKGVKYSVFVPMLIKAVQELKAEIEILKNK